MSVLVTGSVSSGQSESPRGTIERELAVGSCTRVTGPLVPCCAICMMHTLFLTRTWLVVLPPVGCSPTGYCASHFRRQHFRRQRIARRHQKTFKPRPHLRPAPCATPPVDFQAATPVSRSTVLRGHHPVAPPSVMVHADLEAALRRMRAELRDESFTDMNLSGALCAWRTRSRRRRRCTRAHDGHGDGHGDGHDE